MKKMKLYHYVPNIILSVIITFLILVLTAIIIFLNVILKPETYNEALKNNSVDVTAFNEINAYADRQKAYTGVKPEVIKSAIKQQDVSDAMYAYVTSTIKYMSADSSEFPVMKMDFTQLEENINNDYKQWAADNNVDFDDKLEKIKNKTITNAETVINSKLDIMMFSYFNKDGGISSKMHRFHWAIIAGGIVIGIIIAILLLIIFFSSKSKLRNLLYWFGCSLISASAIIIIPLSILKFTKYYDGLAIKNDTLYQAFTNVLYEFTSSTIIYGIVMLAVAIILFILSKLLDRTHKN